MDNGELKKKICSDIMQFVQVQKQIVEDVIQENRARPFGFANAKGQRQAYEVMEQYLKLYCAEIGEKICL